LFKFIGTSKKSHMKTEKNNKPVAVKQDQLNGQSLPLKKAVDETT